MHGTGDTGADTAPSCSTNGPHFGHGMDMRRQPVGDFGDGPKKPGYGPAATDRNSLHRSAWRSSSTAGTQKDTLCLTSLLIDAFAVVGTRLVRVRVVATCDVWHWLPRSGTSVCESPVQHTADEAGSVPRIHLTSRTADLAGAARYWLNRRSALCARPPLLCAVPEDRAGYSGPRPS